jgi:hypothetical protein
MASEKRYNNVLDIIDKRLIPNEAAKKARGEVFTPLKLVREMLFGLRKSALDAGITEIWGIDATGRCVDDDGTDRVGGIPLEVWRDPTKKWLDPANGIGNFPVVTFYMLDYQLGNHGPVELRGDANKGRRRKHIVEHMLYMVEINKGNVNTSRNIFEQMVPGAKANICCADTLSMTDAKLMEVFGVNRFDVVMGNPPFNEGGTKHHTGRGFYTNFISYGFNILSPNGVLVFIHPPNYHRIDKDEPAKGFIVKQLFSDNNLLFLRIIADTKTHFDVQIAIDYYILQKKANTKEAIILDKHNILTSGIDISIFETVPNFGFGIIKKLETLKEREGKFNAIIGRDSAKHTSRLDLFKDGKYPIVHLINNDGVRIVLATTKHPYQDTPKVIINGLGVPYVLDDSSGKYGVSQVPNYILNPSTKEKIFLFSNLFQYLNWAYRIQGNNNDRYLFDVMPDLNKFEFDSDDTMYTALGLNKIDIAEIKKIKMPVFHIIEKKEVAGEDKVHRAKTERKKTITTSKGGARRYRKTRRIRRLL